MELQALQALVRTLQKEPDLCEHDTDLLEKLDARLTACMDRKAFDMSDYLFFTSILNPRTHTTNSHRYPSPGEVDRTDLHGPGTECYVFTGLQTDSMAVQSSWELITSALLDTLNQMIGKSPVSPESTRTGLSGAGLRTGRRSRSHAIMHGGSGFSHAGKVSWVHKIRDLVRRLPEFGGDAHKDALRQLQDAVKVCTDLTAMRTLGDSFRGLFRLRWEFVFRTPLEYTREQGQQNALWIGLARTLAGAGIVDANYYGVLMPTLESGIDPVMHTPFVEYPLEEFVVSRDGKSLIHMRVCEQYHAVHGVYMNCSGSSPRPLLPDEIASVLNAAPRFRDYYVQHVCSVPDAALKSATIDQVAKFVDGCFFSAGLEYGKQYSASQMESFFHATEEFQHFLHSLDPEERVRLDNQIITVRVRDGGPRTKTFGAVWKDIFSDVCVATSGKYLIQLVLDYDPLYCFKPDIQFSSWIGAMRKHAARKVFSDYQDRESGVLTTRLLTLCAWLMNHPMETRWSPRKPVVFLEWKSTLSDAAANVLSFLEPLVRGDGAAYVRHYYQSVMRFVHAKADQGSVFGSLFFLDEDADWIKRVKNGSLFSPLAYWWEPEYLYSWSERMGKTTDWMVSAFPGEGTRGCAADSGLSNLVRFRVNMVFSRWIQTQPGWNFSKVRESLRAFALSGERDALLRRAREALLPVDTPKEAGKSQASSSCLPMEIPVCRRGPEGENLSGGIVISYSI